MDPGNAPFDAKRMIYSGFGSLVKVQGSQRSLHKLCTKNPLALTLRSRMLCNTK
jgi:hypothetical protein